MSWKPSFFLPHIPIHPSLSIPVALRGSDAEAQRLGSLPEVTQPTANGEEAGWDAGRELCDPKLTESNTARGGPATQHGQLLPTRWLLHSQSNSFVFLVRAQREHLQTVLVQEVTHIRRKEPSRPQLAPMSPSPQPLLQSKGCWPSSHRWSMIFSISAQVHNLVTLVDRDALCPGDPLS